MSVARYVAVSTSFCCNRRSRRIAQKHASHAAHLILERLFRRVPLLRVRQCRVVIDGKVVRDTTLTFWQHLGEVAEDGTGQARIRTQSRRFVLPRREADRVSTGMGSLDVLAGAGAEGKRRAHRSDAGRVFTEPDEVVLVRPQVVVRQQVERLDGRDAAFCRMPKLKERNVCRVEGGGDGGGAAVAVERIQFGRGGFRVAAAPQRI